MAFRTSYLQERGGFDEALGAGTVAMGGDDLAAFYDVISGGNRLVYEPAAIVLHQHPRHYAALKRQAYGYGAGLGAHLTRAYCGALKWLWYSFATRPRSSSGAPRCSGPAKRQICPPILLNSTAFS
jgi:hypothetical protein